MSHTGTEVPVSPERILQTGLAFWASKTLLSAVELELFTALSERPSTADDLRERLGLHPRSSLDFFDTLVALGFLTRTGDVYANAPDTDVFLDKRKPSYVGGILEMANQRLFGFWKKKMLVRKAYDALPAGGAFIVYEAVIDDERRKNAFGLLMSLNMLIETPGGFDYTGADCIGWMKEAGFREGRVEHLVGPDSMVVGIK